MLKNVALDSAATALALREEVKTVIQPIIPEQDYQQLHANSKAQFELCNHVCRVGEKTSLTSMVFPLPGGPNRSRPRAGALRPVKSWKEKHQWVFKANLMKQNTFNVWKWSPLVLRLVGWRSPGALALPDPALRCPQRIQMRHCSGHRKLL